MITVYGITDNEGIHTDVSNSLLGAKQYATRHSYNCVSIRHGYNVTMLEYKLKDDKHWYKYEDFLSTFTGLIFE
jgi:hypothetical protein